MPNDPIGAAAEGLPAVQTCAEDPHDRARRLAAELAETLNDAFGGRFGAEVYPSRATAPSFPAGFFDLRSHRLAWMRGAAARAHLRRLRRMTVDERIEFHLTRLKRALTVQEASRGGAR